MTKACANCVYYVPFNEVGQCRIRAPIVGFVALHSANSKLLNPKSEPHRVTSFPIVEADCWCGEYRQAPLAKVKKIAA